MKLYNSVMKTTTDSELDMKIVKGCIETTGEALTLFDEFAERFIPWKELIESFAELAMLRNDLTTESISLMGEIKSHLMHGVDAFFMASQHMNEWAGTAVSNLASFVSLFNGNNGETQKKLLNDILDSGIEKMGAAQAELDKNWMSFNSGAERLTVMRNKFDKQMDAARKAESKQIRMGLEIFAIIDELRRIFKRKETKISFDKMIELLEAMNGLKKFYGNLDEKVREALRNIETMEEILKTKIQDLSDLKIRIQRKVAFRNLDSGPDVRDAIIKTAQNLTIKFQEYRKKHINKIDSY